MHNNGITSEEYVQKLLGIPENMKVESIISVGYPAEKKSGIPKEKLLFKKIRINKF